MSVQVGVVFPQTEIGNDPGAIRAYAEAAEDLGYAHIAAYEHVLGAAPREGFRGPYNVETPFHEPFVLFGFLAAVVQRVGFVTAVVVLPQRQTALVAKQAAALDVLSGGRLRLGAGIGWNYVEFEALGTNFRDRGRRVTEQIKVLRLLWTQEVVDFAGKWHRIDRAGIRPLPIQRPIPVWMGGTAEPALKRIARIADGWLPQFLPNEEGRAMLERFRGYVRDAGRDPATFPIEARVSPFRLARKHDVEAWAEAAQTFAEWGCSHLELNTMSLGLGTDEHIDAIRRFREATPVFTG